jgi:hypothetical protein
MAVGSGTVTNCVLIAGCYIPWNFRTPKWMYLPCEAIFCAVTFLIHIPYIDLLQISTSNLVTCNIRISLFCRKWGRVSFWTFGRYSRWSSNGSNSSNVWVGMSRLQISTSATCDVPAQWLSLIVPHYGGALLTRSVPHFQLCLLMHQQAASCGWGIPRTFDLWKGCWVRKISCRAQHKNRRLKLMANWPNHNNLIVSDSLRGQEPEGVPQKMGMG